MGFDVNASWQKQPHSRLRPIMIEGATRDRVLALAKDCGPTGASTLTITR